MSLDPHSAPDAYPRGGELQAQIQGRHRTGRIGRLLFLAATFVAVLTLIVLVINITNQSFGLVAEQNVVPPAELVHAYYQAQLLRADHATVLEEGEALAAAVADDPAGLGFLSYETFTEHAGDLKALTIDGEAPAAGQPVVAVHPSNTAVNDLSLEQVQALLTTAGTWAEVDESWPAQTIHRYLPDPASNTFDQFVDSTFATKLADLPKSGLVALLAGNISHNAGRRLEREQRFFETLLVFEDEQTWAELCARAEPPQGCTAGPRSQENVYLLLQERVVRPTILETWYLWPSLTQRPAIMERVAEQYPQAEVRFKSWMTAAFLTNPQSSIPELAGVRTAILGSLWVIAITLLFSFPLGVAAAIYLEEYADQTKWYNRIIQTNINNLAGVPSIIYGMLGLTVFVRALDMLTSGAIFGVNGDVTANGRTILSAGLTLGLLVLPIIIISSQEAIRAVPGSLRQASYGLGATRWQTIWYHVLPSAMPGILTGSILAMSRAIGETAPLVVIGASTYITVDPDGPFSRFTVLPIQIYQWTSRPQQIFRNLAGGAIIVLLFMLLSLNATAIILRNRFSRQERS
jgi:phosphate transport system permease protein